MSTHICKTGWVKNLLLGAGLLALLVLLAPAEAGAVDLIVDGGNTLFVPPSISYYDEIIGNTGQGTLTQFGAAASSYPSTPRCLPPCSSWVPASWAWVFWAGGENG
jgi:hypothetical protein